MLSSFSRVKRRIADSCRYVKKKIHTLIIFLYGFFIKILNAYPKVKVGKGN